MSDIIHPQLPYCFNFLLTVSFLIGRALQRAAAAAAIERARRARTAQGVPAKGGGGGKGKAVEEREEECQVCSSEFTIRGDGGESF